jgi:hypothetical protein
VTDWLSPPAPETDAVHGVTVEPVKVTLAGQLSDVTLSALVMDAVVVALEAREKLPDAGPLRASPETFTVLPAPAVDVENTADAPEESHVTPTVAGLNEHDVIVAKIMPS